MSHLRSLPQAAALSLLCALLLDACFPFRATIDDPDPARYDPTLLGHWLQTNAEEGQEPLCAQVQLYGVGEYQVDARWSDSDTTTVCMRMRAYLCDFGGTTFLTLRPLAAPDDTNSYAMMRFVRTGAEEIDVTMVSGRSATETATRDTLRAMIDAGIRAGDLYDAEVLKLRRVAD